jgi:oligoribonuclease (3'-5' exoribonuclease)
MTGLTSGKDKIIEVAAIITDKELEPFDEGFERIIHCDEEIMNGMDEWCTEHHRDVSPPIPLMRRVAHYPFSFPLSFLPVSHLV